MRQAGDSTCHPPKHQTPLRFDTCGQTFFPGVVGVSVTGCTIRSQTGAIGWSDTTVPEVTGNAYSEEVDELGRAIRAYRRAEGGRLLTPGTPGSDDGDQGDEDDKDAEKRRNGVSLICGCATHRRIRLALSVADAGPITCGLCGEDFVEVTLGGGHGGSRARDRTS